MPPSRASCAASTYVLHPISVNRDVVECVLRMQDAAVGQPPSYHAATVCVAAFVMLLVAPLTVREAWASTE